MCVYMRIHIYIYICVCACVYIYIYIQSCHDNYDSPKATGSCVQLWQPVLEGGGW